MNKYFLYGIFFPGCLLLLLQTNAQGVEAITTDTVSMVEPPAEEEEYYEDNENAEVSDTILISTATTRGNDSLRLYKHQKDFAYIKNLDSLLRRWQEEEKKNGEQAEDQRIQTGKIESGISALRILLWIAAISLALFIIYRLFLSEKGLFARAVKNKKIELEHAETTGDQFFEAQLKQAIAAADYRLAIRYLYLQLLAQVADKGWLHLSPDKTNYQYARELKPEHLRKDFRTLLMHYEYSWYGDFAVNRMIFEKINNEYNDFRKKIIKA